jgi:MYXO-CTERM domain-containing protein
MKWGVLLWAFALLAVSRSAAGQECPAAEFGQPCTGGNVGTCVQLTCSSVDSDGGTTEQPCGKCEPVECPTTAIGQPCEAGTCTAATCESLEGGPCAVCVAPDPNACPADQAGMPCSDGGTCTASNDKALGPAGAGPPSQVVYSVWTCQVPVVLPDGGNDLMNEVDASAEQGTTGGAAHATSNGGNARASNGGSGCGVSTTSTPLEPSWWLLVGGLALISLRAKRRGQGMS